MNMCIHTRFSNFISYSGTIWRILTNSRLLQRELVMATPCTTAVTVGQNFHITNIDCWPWPSVPQTQRLSFLCARCRPTPWSWSFNVALSSGNRFTRWRHFKIVKWVNSNIVVMFTMHWPWWCKNCIIIFRSLLDIWENVEWPRFLAHPV